jgi:hypothetical protein
LQTQSASGDNMRVRAALVLLFVPSVLGQLLAISTELRLKRFVERIPRLRNEGDLGEYRTEVRWQMYAALVGIVLLFGPLILFLGGWITGHFNGLHVFLVSIPGYAGLRSVKNIGANARMKQLPAETEMLATQRDAITTTWRKKALPNF